MRHSRVSRTVATAMVAVVLGAACSSTTPSADAFCSQIEKLTQLDVTLNGDSTELAEAAAGIEDLARVSPAEVRPSVEVLSDALATLSQATRGLQSDSAEALDAVMGALTPIISDIEEASDTIESYTQQNCNFSLSESDTTQSP